jgi:hypothetical protein
MEMLSIQFEFQTEVHLKLSPLLKFVNQNLIH